MKTFFRFALGAGLLASLLTGCRTSAGNPSSHWNIDSVDNRIAKHFTGYRGPIDGRYLDYQREKKKDISLTLRRHFLGNNPTNPFQVEDESRTRPDGPYGPLPNPFFWFHVETLIFAPIAPIPVDSLLALTSDGGVKEFGQTFTGMWSNEQISPPAPSSFEVKNR